MKALVVDQGLQLLHAYPIPEHTGNELLVRVVLAGICNTDLEILRGYKGFTGILGHEFVGEVVAGSEPSWIGQRVCGEINVACGKCATCSRGMPSHCLNRSVLGILGRDGAFAQYLTLPLENLHPVPAQVADEEAVFVEPLAAAFEILEQVSVDRNTRVIVLGDGKLGNLCAQVLDLAGAAPIVVGKHPEKLELLRRRGIQTQVLGEGVPNPADLVIEATGSVTGIAMALQIVRPRGTIVLKSTIAAPGSIDLSPAVVKEVALVGSRCGPFPRALDALIHRRVTVTDLIEATYPLAAAIDAIAHAGRRGSLKVLIDPG